jgi:hypothetical protein
MHLVDQLEEVYEQPGVVAMNQHTANTRKLERHVERTLDAKPKDTPKEQPEPEPTDYLGGQPSASPTDQREQGRFVSPRDQSDLDSMAHLVYRAAYNATSDEDNRVLAFLRTEHPQDLRAGRRRWHNTNKRIQQLRRMASTAPETMTPDQGRELRHLQTRFPLAMVESFFQDDPVLSHMYESVATMRVAVNGDDPRHMYVFPDRDSTTEYFTLTSRDTAGWLDSGIVRRGEPAPEPEDDDITTAPEMDPDWDPESPDEDDEAARGAEDAARRVGDRIGRREEPAPAPSPAPEPTPTMTDELTPEEQELHSRIEAILNDFQAGGSSPADIEKRINEVWMELTKSFGLRRKKPGLQGELRSVLQNVRTAPEAGEPSAADRPQAGASFEDEVLSRATQYRTGLKWWKLGLRKYLNAIKLSGNYRVTKSREAREGVEYAIKSPAYEKVIYVWVPNEGATDTSSPWAWESPMHLSPDLKELLEQDYDVSGDPKGEAPPEAFGIPPLPPGMDDPEGGEGEQAAPIPGEPPEPEVESKPRRVVATQNNVWWELSWDNWVQFLVLGASGANWNLDHWGARYPEGKPNDIRDFVSMDQGPTKYYSTDPNTNVHYVKGWTPERFKKELDYVQAMDVAGLSLVEPKPPADEAGILSTR